MQHHFESAYNNYWHFTIESILPIIHKLPEIQKGDTVFVPDYSIYPISFIRKILPECEVIQVDATPPKVYAEGYLRTYDNYILIRQLCTSLMSYVPSHSTKLPGLFLNFRLHNRMWTPLTNLQDLINKLKDKYTIFLSLNPTVEKATHVPDITGATLIYDLSYEEQLSYAKSCVTGIYMNGAGMIFAQIADLPAIMLTPCKMEYIKSIDINYNTDKKIIVLSDNKALKNNWNSNVETISVDDVINNFNLLNRRK